MALRIAIVSIISTIILFSNNLSGQGAPIEFYNPSFEGAPRAGRAPSNWYDCGAYMHPGETPPDVHGRSVTPEGKVIGVPNNFFQVNTTAQDGNTFLGLVVREMRLGKG